MKKTTFTVLILLVFTPKFLVAQENKINVIQDVKFEKLLNEKRKVNGSIVNNDRYKIQIFNGDSENAKKNLVAFRKAFANYDATIVFNTPTYKVMVGNFKTRIETERNLIEIKKTYKNALLIRPKS